MYNNLELLIIGYLPLSHRTWINPLALKALIQCIVPECAEGNSQSVFVLNIGTKMRLNNNAHVSESIRRTLLISCISKKLNMK